MLQFDDAVLALANQVMRDVRGESSCSEYDLHMTGPFFETENVHPLNIPPLMGLLC